MDKAQPSELVDAVTKAIWAKQSAEQWEAGVLEMDQVREFVDEIAKAVKDRIVAGDLIERLTPTPEPCGLREALERAAENFERLQVPHIVGHDVHNFAYQAGKAARAALSASPAEHAIPGPEMEAVMRAAAFRSTEHQYDIPPAEPEEATEAMIEAGDKVLAEYWAIPCAARIGAVRRVYAAMRSAAPIGGK